MQPHPSQILIHGYLYFSYGSVLHACLATAAHDHRSEFQLITHSAPLYLDHERRKPRTGTVMHVRIVSMLL